MPLKTQEWEQGRKEGREGKRIWRMIIQSKRGGGKCRWMDGWMVVDVICFFASVKFHVFDCPIVRPLACYTINLVISYFEKERQRAERQTII